MNRGKKTLIICMSVIIFVIMSAISLIVFIDLVNTGYIFITNQTPGKTENIFKYKSEINFKEIIEKDWDFAIIVTNKNEMEIIRQYQKKGIIDVECNYYGLDPGIQQLGNIIFFSRGKYTEHFAYDRRYYTIDTKEEKIFYPNDCTFKVKKGMFKTTLEQI